MALHTIQIVVVDGGKEGSYAANNATRKSKDTEKEKYKDSGLYKILNFNKTVKDKINKSMTIETRYMLGQAISMGTQVIKSMASYYISDIGRSTGDSNYQAIVNRRMEIAGQYVSVIGSTLSGAATGAMAGPIGAVMGAVVGLASSTMSIGFQNAEKQRAYNHTMAEERAGIEYNKGRMTGGTGIRLR